MKRFIYLMIIAASMIAFACSSTSPTGSKMYGGTGNQSGRSIQQTSDGGYIVAGFSDSSISGVTGYGKSDYYVVKLNSKRTVEWQKMYGGSGNEGGDYYYFVRHGPCFIQQTSDGGYVLGGASNSTDISGLTNHGGTDVYIIKLDSTGTVQWQKMYGGSDYDEASSIQQTADGGYILAGRSASTDINGAPLSGFHDVYVMKLDGIGAVVWQKMYGGSEGEYARSIRQTGDGGYILAGISRSSDISGLTYHGQTDYYVVKLDSSGSVEWQNMLGGSNFDWAHSILQTSDGGYIIAGESESLDIEGVSSHGYYDCYVIKLDISGSVAWQYMYGGSDHDMAYSIQLTSDGGYIIAGDSLSTDITGVTNHGEDDAYLIKLDGNGTVVWQKMYGGSGVDFATSVIQTSDGGYIFAGESASTDIYGITNHGGSDFYVVQLDENGDL